MGTRKVIKAKANKKSVSAARASAAAPDGWNVRRAPVTGHVKKAKHHQTEEGRHKSVSRAIHINTDTGKVKRHNRDVSTGTRANIGRIVREHDTAAKRHGQAKRAHIKAAKSRKKK